MTQATVVIVTWQGAHLLGPCLDALAAQTLGAGSFRTLVVDNASTDGTAELLAGITGVDVVRSPHNIGFAGGATLGMGQVTTPYAVVLNNDALPEPAWLERLLAGFSPDVAAVTSKVLLMPRYVALDAPLTGPDGLAGVTVDGADVTGSVVLGRGRLLVPAPEHREVAVTARAADGREVLSVTVAPDAPRVDVINSVGGVLTATGHGADRGYLEIDSGQYDADEDVAAVCGAAAAFRTDVGRALGWFDPWFFAYYEDLDLSWRLRRAGWRIRYVADARVRHHHAATSRIGSDVFLFHNRRNRLATLVRNASARQLTGFVVSSLRTREVPAAVLLPPRMPAPHGPAPRGKQAALLSLMARLPVLVAGRVLDARRLRRLRPTNA